MFPFADYYLLFWVTAGPPPAVTPMSVGRVRAVPRTTFTIRGKPVAGSVTTLYTDSIVMYRGDDVGITVTLPPGTNAAGWAVSFHVAASVGASPVVTKTISPSNTVVYTTLAAADTASMDTGDYVYSFRRTDSGSVTTLAQGKLSLFPVA